MKPIVLFVDGDPGWSGATVSMEFLIRAFVEAEYRVAVVTPKNDGDRERLAQTGATVRHQRPLGMTTMAMDLHFTSELKPLSLRGIVQIAKNMGKVLFGIADMLRTILILKPDVVYCNEYVVLQGAIAAHLCGRPAVTHVRSPFATGTFGVRRRLLRFFLLKCNKKVFAITRLEANQLGESHRTRAQVMVVGEFTEPPLPSDNERARTRQTLGLMGGQTAVLMLGGVSRIKGTLDFLKAASAVQDRHADVVFLIAGGEPASMSPADESYKAACMEWTRTLEQQGALRVLGAYEKVDRLIMASDILVSPSTQTHFSRPVIEAWSYGKAVVAAATTHMHDLIVHEYDGLLFPVGDHHALADAIIRLAESPDLRRSLGHHGNEKVRREYDGCKNTRTIVRECTELL